MMVAERVGAGGIDLSVSDVALAAAFGTALLLGHHPYSLALRRLLVLNLIYQFATLFTVIVNPNVQNTTEWFHAWLLVSGALIVGWALGRAGHARIALLLLLGAASAIAVGTIFTGLFQYLGGDFDAVYPLWPFPMHKNAAGTMMAFAALIAYLRPDWARLPVGWSRAAFWLLIVAIVMTQSRQALIGLIVAMVVIAARRGGPKHSRWPLLLVVPALWLIITTVSDQINSQNEHNSVLVRLGWFREVYALWKESPLFGHGLRYWYTKPESPFQPPQGELEVLASAGVIGLIGFTIMWIGILIVLWKIDPRYGTLAFAVVLSRIVQGQFDLFWVAGQVSVPFLIAGICVGAKALDDARNADPGAFATQTPSRRRAPV